MTGVRPRPADRILFLRRAQRVLFLGRAQRVLFLGRAHRVLFLGRAVFRRVWGFCSSKARFPARPAGAVATLAVLVLAGAGAFAWRDGPAEVSVAAGTHLGEAVRRAQAGAVVRLEPGIHRGPVFVDAPVTITGPRTAVIAAPRNAPATIAVRAGDVTLEGFKVDGGETGISVAGVENVRISDVEIAGAAMEGIDVADAGAVIHGAIVHDLASPLGQGIEIRNSEHRGTIIVSGSTVTGGQEGIVAHVSRVRFEDNAVRATTMHAISITEMSRGVAARNVVEGAAGAGLYCGDMSRCEFRDNEVAEVGASAVTRSSAGWGLLVHYHSSASSSGDELAGQAGPVGVFEESHLRDASPLRVGEGWRGLVPALWVVPLALAALWLGGRIARPIVRPSTQAPARWATPLVLAGLSVQTFHMLEHGLQVYRVHFDGVPSRGGIVGPSVEAEWIHFVYNTLVFVALALTVRARRRGWGAASPGADLMLAGAAALQGYHVFEHTLKVIQHATSGAKVNPGLAGEVVDLVWFHFGINLAVYAGFVGAAVLLLAPLRRVRPLVRPRRAAPVD